MSELSGAPPRKRFRKGTHSCLECRRRKIKCTYDANPSGGGPCDVCLARRTTCQSQDHNPRLATLREPTRERVDRLEVVIENLSKSMAELQEWRAGANPAARATEATPVSMPSREECSNGAGSASWDGEYYEDGDDGDDDAATTQATTPAGSVMGWDEEEEWAAATPEERRLTGIRRRLTRLVPSRDDALTITASAMDWWTIYRTMLPPPPITSKVDLIGKCRDLCLPDTHLGTMGTWFCCMAITFRQLPPSYDYSVLESVPDPLDYANRIGKEVEALLAEDSVMGTFEGMECAVMFAQLQKVMARPKKGWRVLRRAITFAELLRLPAAANVLRNSKNASESQKVLLKTKANVWESLCATDRLLCLLLGLPNASASLNTAPTIDPNDPHSRTRRIAWIQSDMANYIAYRDHMEDGDEAFDKTQRIAEKLRCMQQGWPSEWSSVDRWTEYDAAVASSVLLRTSHSYLVLRTHLPYLVKAKHDLRYAGNASECLQACRETLRHYFAVRTRHAIGGFMSRSFDTLAFTASVVLLLHRRPTDPGLTLSSATDAALIENVRTAMRHGIDRAGEALIQRMIHSLDSIQQCVEGHPGSASGLKLKVPILGKVTVRRIEAPPTTATASSSTTTSPTAAASPALISPTLISPTLTSPIRFESMTGSETASRRESTRAAAHPVVVVDIAFDFDAVDDHMYLQEDTEALQFEGVERGE